MTQTSSLKKVIAFAVTIAVICVSFAGVVIWNAQSEDVLAAEGEKIITLQIGNPQMTVDGTIQPIDAEGTVPVVVNDRTLVPVRAIIEAAGGTVEWNQDTQETTLQYEEDVIRLTIGSTTAYLNDEAQTLDVTPAIINDRTMLPIRFIAESFHFLVGWTQETETVSITVPSDSVTGTETTPAPSDPAAASTVYMTSEISSEALMEIYNRLGFTPQGNVAVKLSTGEAGNDYHLDPELIKDLVQSVDGTIVECNTAYGGSRASTAVHMQTAEDHGFTAIADVDIMDADGTIQLPVTDKAENLEYDIVGKNYENYDSMLVLSHFKGHAMGGFGGAIKNISIGIASQNGKMYIHSGGHSDSSWGGGTQDQFLESMAEAAQAVHNNKQEDGGIVYISVMNNLSVDCDCDADPEAPEMHDVGILASYDPVALDQACVDIVYNTDIDESGALRERIESRNGIHTLEHAAKIGLGNRTYNLVNIDQ